VQKTCHIYSKNICFLELYIQQSVFNLLQKAFHTSLFIESRAKVVSSVRIDNRNGVATAEYRIPTDCPGESEIQATFTRNMEQNSVLENLSVKSNTSSKSKSTVPRTGRINLSLTDIFLTPFYQQNQYEKYN
jgi:hypothetical protein